MAEKTLIFAPEWRCHLGDSQFDMQSYLVFVKYDHENAEPHVVKPFTFATYKDSQGTSSEDVTFTRNAGLGGFKSGEIAKFVQAFMDEAWSKGFRPSGLQAPVDIAKLEEGWRAELMAVNAHLGDMRTIAFKKIGVEKS